LKRRLVVIDDEVGTPGWEEREGSDGSDGGYAGRDQAADAESVEESG
jgi:hypothetical protein